LLLSFITNGSFSAEKQEKLLTQNWSFNGFFGKFDRASLQRGYQVYTEVCASCHSMNLLSYRNLSEVGGPSFSEEEVKAIASKVEVLDGPNDNRENHLINLSVLSLMKKPQELQTAVHILRICQF